MVRSELVVVGNTRGGSGRVAFVTVAGLRRDQVSRAYEGLLVELECCFLRFEVRGVAVSVEEVECCWILVL